MKNVIKLVFLTFIPLIIFAQSSFLDEQEWPCRSGIDTARYPGAPVMDEVRVIEPANPNYQNYHIILSPVTGETLKIYGCKVKVENDFCGICRPETQSGPIDAFLLDPNYQYIPPDYKRTEPWSFTPLYAPRGFLPESAIVWAYTERQERDTSEPVLLWTGEKRAYGENVRVSWVSWHPAWIRYYRWKQVGEHEAVYYDPNPPYPRYRVHTGSVANLFWW